MAPLVSGRAHSLVIILSHDIADISLEHFVELLFRVVHRIHLIGVPRDGMVHVTVLGLIGPDSVDRVQDRALLTKLPVRAGNLGSGLGPPASQVGALGGLLDGGDNLGVGMACFLLDVSNKTMAEGWTGNVRKEEGSAKANLTSDHRGTEDGTGLLELDEGEEMHTLVVGLLEEHVEHASIALHIAKGGEVTDDSSNHTRDSGVSLQEDRPIQDLLGCDLTTVPASGGIKH